MLVSNLTFGLFFGSFLGPKKIPLNCHPERRQGQEVGLVHMHDEEALAEGHARCGGADPQGLGLLLVERLS